MHFAIMIPARRASTRLPDKLLLERTGQPLICHTVDVALAAMAAAGGRIAETLVAADDEAICAAVDAYAAKRVVPVRAVMTRTDHPSGSDRIAEAMESLPAEVDAIVNVQGDEPELAPADVVRLLDVLEVGQGMATPTDIATLVYPITDPQAFSNPNLVKAVFGTDGAALYFSRAPIPFDRDDEGQAGDVLGFGHVGLYAYRRDALTRFVSLPQGALEQRERLEQLRALENGMRIAVGVLDTAPPKGIDTEADYAAFVRRSTKRRKGNG